MPGISDPDDPTRLLREFDASRSDWEDLGRRVSDLVKDLLRSAGIRTHSTDYRVKSKAGLERKLRRGEAKYQSLGDVTDLLGLRIITYFPDEVDAAGAVIESNFDVDGENSIDRRAALEPDRFGYLSLHYVVGISAERAALPEWARFGTMKVEIQLRSILQHAWAEIEHDLGYQTEVAIPGPLRRRFSRLAGLLEVADEEFARIRDDLALYVGSLDRNVRREPESVGIDQHSIMAVLRRNTRLKALDKTIAGLITRKRLRPTSKTFASRRAELLQFLGLKTIQDVEWAAEHYADEVRGFAEAWIGPDHTDHPAFPRGIALYYLELVLAANPGSVASVEAYLGRAGYTEPDELAQRILNTLHRLRGLDASGQ